MVYTSCCVYPIQAVLSRAELLLSSSCSNQAAVDVVLKAMEAAVEAWSRLEAQEAEKRRKEAEILKYKMQEHVVSTTSIDVGRFPLTALNPMRYICLRFCVRSR